MDEREPERKMAALFEGLGRMERLALLGRLEAAGAALYRALAETERNARAREKLLAAAADEERNGGLLRGMSTPKGECEKCGAALPAAALGGMACSFQCTFCEACAEAMSRTCPNCAGPLEPRQDRARE